MEEDSQDQIHYKKSCRILLVEDNRIAQLATKAILSTLHCLVHIAANGEEALMLFKKNPYDLILMDIGLGEGMDGYEVTYSIRSLPNAIPIVALTAHAGEDNKQCCLEAGMNAVLTKPLTKIQAMEILTSFIPAGSGVVYEKVIVSTTEMQVKIF